MLIQYLLLAAFAGALALTWKRVKKGLLGVIAAFWWSALWIAAAVIVLRPETASVMARVLGVGRGADVIVYLSVVVIFYLIFRLFARLDSLERQMTKVVRELALKDLDTHDTK